LETLKVLGQVAPSATTATTLYTVPALTTAVVSTLTICNRGIKATVRIAVRPSGAVLENKHYIAYDTPIEANDMKAITIGMTLATTDVVTVYASTADFSFSLFGSEVS